MNRKVIGIAMFVLLFGGLFILVGYATSWWKAIAGFAGTAFLLGYVYIATEFMLNDKRK
ncbi:MAG: hypothetical protein ACTHMM_10015 [Agriterribacter sp.]